MEYVKEFAGKLYKKGAFQVFIGQFLTKFVAFFGSIFVVKFLTKSEYGVITYYENLYSYAHILAGLGMSNSILRYVVLGREKHEKYSYFSFCLRRGLLADTAIGLVLAVITFVYHHPADYAPYAWMLVICAYTLPFQDLFACELNNERAMLSNNRYAIISFLVSSCVIGGRIAAAKLFGMNGVLASQLIIYVVWSVLIYITDKKTYFSGLEYRAPERAKQGEIWSYSLQYMVTNGLWAVFMLNDIYMLGRFNVSAESLADYKVAYVFPGNISIISSAIGIIVVPYFIKREKDLDWVRRNFKKMLFAAVGAIAAVSAVLAAVARPLIILLYGETYANIIPMMRVMIIAAFINAGIRFTFANTLAAMGKVKYNMIASGVGVGMQIILNIVFIPRLGTWGPVVTSIIVQLVMSSFLAVVFYNLYYRKKADAR